MTRNTALAQAVPLPDALAGRSIVLVGLMGAGKTSIGRRLAARLDLPFRDADLEIEAAAGCTIPELFARYGEPAFRDGERRVIRRLLAAEPMVLAFGGGAFMDPETRAAVRAEAISVWLRCSLPTLVRRVAGRDDRPLLAGGDPHEILARLMGARHPDLRRGRCDRGLRRRNPETTPSQVLDAVLGWRAPRRLSVALGSGGYDVVIGDGLLRRAGALLAPVLPQKRAVVITDATVAPLHLPALLAGLAETAIETRQIVVPAGEASKTIETWAGIVDRLLEDAGGAAHHGDRARRRRGGRPRRLRRRHHPARPALRADPHHPAGAGRQLGRRQDRGEHRARARTWWARSTSRAWCWPTPRPSPPCRCANCAPATPRSLKAGLIGDAAFFDWCEAPRHRGRRRRRRSPGRGDPARLRLQGRRGRRRRARGKAERRPRPAQPRPHLRPRAGGGIRLLRRAAARRRRGDRPRPRVPPVGPARPLPARRTRRGCARIWRRSA